MKKKNLTYAATSIIAHAEMIGAMKISCKAARGIMVRYADRFTHPTDSGKQITTANDLTDAAQKVVATLGA